MTEHTTTEGLTDAEADALLLAASSRYLSIAGAVERILADRLAAVQAERDRWQDMHRQAFDAGISQQNRAEAAEAEVAAAEQERDDWRYSAEGLAARAESAEAERDAARSEVEALRERVGALADEYAVAAEAHKAALGSMGEVQLCTGVVADLRAALDGDR